MFAFIVTIIGLSLLIFVHEAGHFFVAKIFKLKIDEFGFGLPPRAWGKKVGETIYSLNWLPFGGFVKIYGEEGGEALTGNGMPEGWHAVKAGDSEYHRSFNAQKPWVRSLIIVAGVFMNFLLGWILITVVFMIGAPKGVYITEIADNSPAQAAGLLPGDKILDYEHADDFIGFIKQAEGLPAHFQVVRDGKTVDVDVTPRVNPPEGEGALGIALTEGGGRLGFFPAIWEGLKTTLYLIQAIAVALWHLISGIFVGAADLKGVVGPVGIFGVAESAGRMGFVYLLNLIALISINLGVINIIPFPALDGGRFLFIIIEKIKGSPLPQRFERYANAFGFATLLLLILLITLRDIRNLL